MVLPIVTDGTETLKTVMSNFGIFLMKSLNSFWAETMCQLIDHHQTFIPLIHMLPIIHTSPTTGGRDSKNR
jgi:hypothetical protein